MRELWEQVRDTIIFIGVIFLIFEAPIGAIIAFSDSPGGTKTMIAGITIYCALIFAGLLAIMLTGQ